MFLQEAHNIMIIVRELFRPSQISLDLIGSVIPRIFPDDHELTSWYEKYASNHKMRLASDLDLIRSNVSPKSVLLEIGAIPPILTLALKESDYSVCGIDIEPDRFSQSIMKSALQINKVNVETQALPFASGSFQVVIFNEFFEHLRINPIFTLQEVNRILYQGGLLFLSTPNLRTFGHVYNLVMGKPISSVYGAYSKLNTLGHMGHVRIYIASEIMDFLYRVGFEIEQIVYRGCYGVGLIKRLIYTIIPSFRERFTIVARYVKK